MSETTMFMIFIGGLAGFALLLFAWVRWLHYIEFKRRREQHRAVVEPDRPWPRRATEAELWESDPHNPAN